MAQERRSRGEVTIAGREDADGLALVTRGLSARGLPELTVTGLPPYLGRAWARLLAVLAHRLAAGAAGAGAFPRAASSEVPAQVTIVPDDLRAALNEPSGDWRQVTVLLVRDGDRLVPSPPADFDGPLDRWRADLATLLFPSARS
ncbi:hypothetical protein [Thermomonospora umbrina]|uniref:Uncharacterized protein n=1 Tax=Thermomonospora umbrina TaxID=111806 RepID=A0A3D9SWI3_9ACTN|nr:hypothetical protein [Thermomonospora umbrina]REE96001.1 hypothetical protein DFJ69_1421 [Thermomonospora umbrina]